MTKQFSWRVATPGKLYSFHTPFVDIWETGTGNFVGILDGSRVGALEGTFVGAFVGVRTVALVGVRVGTLTGGFAGPEAGTISNPLMMGLLTTFTNSIDAKPSEIVFVIGMTNALLGTLPAASKTSRLLMARLPST